MTLPIQYFIASIIGATIIIGGISILSDDIIFGAKSAANAANVRQVATALELYYTDHESYPSAADSEGLVNLLEKENYIIKNQPADFTAINYKVAEDQQNYQLIPK